MSDSNKPKPLPPDDFSATTPNIKIPNNNAPDFGNAPASDWEKTNYNYNIKDLQGGDQWNKPAFNPPQTPQIIPPTNPPIQPSNAPKVDEWGMTQANINLPFNNQPNQNQPPVQGDFGSKQPEYGATTPFINLPQNIKEKYQDSPPKFKLDEEEEEQQSKKKGGIPGWIWGVLGLLFMFFFSLIVLGVVWYFFLNKKGVEVVLKGAPPRSDILIDGSNWGVTSDDGTIRLQGLRAGETKKIEIKNANFKCEPQDIKGTDGESIPMIARCTSTGGNTTPTPVTNDKTEPPKDCLPKFAGDYETSRNCAITEIAKLENDDKNGKTFTVNQLLYAMNLYIIQFDKNKFNIKPVDMDFVTRAANLMKKLPANTKIEVGGHTDSDGNPKTNQTLSQNRANAVRNALVKSGVNASILQTAGYGATQPVAPNDNDANKFRNRRIAYSVR